MVYAIVRAGARQEKVEVGTIVVTDRIDAEVGSKVTLPAVLVADGDKISTGEAAGKVKVEAEVVRDERGPKIIILKFKNKTGYRKRKGHRQELTRLKVTKIA